MSAPSSIVRAVAAVLKTKKASRNGGRQGKFSKREIIIDVMRRIRNLGGPSAYGNISSAQLIMAVQHIVEVETTRQMKMPISDHDQRYVLPATTPPEIISLLGKVPQCIAVGEGPNADWVFSLQATAAHWLANSELKEKKASQTMIKSEQSLDISRFLVMNNFLSLEEAMTRGRP